MQQNPWGITVVRVNVLILLYFRSFAMHKYFIKSKLKEMPQQKFQKGDLAKIITTNDKVITLDYKVNFAGSFINTLNSSSEKQLPASVITDDVLCEGRIDGKFQRKYIKEASLELISRAN